MNKAKVIIAAPESDCHVVAIKLLEIYLTGHGVEVLNLGVNTSSAEIVTAVERFQPQAVFVSSQNGHAYSDLENLIPQMQASNLNVPVFIGGTLGIDSLGKTEISSRFKQIGLVVLDTFKEALESAMALGPSAGRKHEIVA